MNVNPSYVSRQRKLISVKSLASSAGKSCESASDCGAWDQCILSKCTLSSKSCINSCSGHGACKFINSYSGAIVESCGVGEMSCSVVCSCAVGFFGSDCSLTNDVFSFKQATRLQLISAFYNMTKKQNIDKATVMSWISTLSSLTQITDEVTTASVSRLASVTSTIISSRTSLGLSSGSLAPILGTINAMSNVGFNLLNSERRRLQTQSPQIVTLSLLVAAYAASVQQDMVAGQTSISYIYSNFRLISEISSSSVDKSSLALSIPLTASELYGGMMASKIVLQLQKPSRVFRSCGIMLNSLTFGAESSSVNSNPIFLLLNDSSQTLPTGFKVVASIANVSPQEYTTPAPHNFTVACKQNHRSNTTFVCPNHQNVSIGCNGNFVGDLTVSCPIIQQAPVCSGAPTVPITGSLECSTQSFSAMSTICQCAATAPATLFANVAASASGGSAGSLVGYSVASSTGSSKFVPKTVYSTFSPLPLPTMSPVMHTEASPNFLLASRYGRIVISLVVLICACSIVGLVTYFTCSTQTSDDFSKKVLWRQESGETADKAEFSLPMPSYSVLYDSEFVALSSEIQIQHNRNKSFRTVLSIPVVPLPARAWSLVSKESERRFTVADLHYLHFVLENLCCENGELVKRMHKKTSSFFVSWKSRKKISKYGNGNFSQTNDSTAESASLYWRPNEWESSQGEDTGENHSPGMDDLFPDARVLRIFSGSQDSVHSHQEMVSKRPRRNRQLDSHHERRNAFSNFFDHFDGGSDEESVSRPYSPRTPQVADKVSVAKISSSSCQGVAGVAVANRHVRRGDFFTASPRKINHKINRKSHMNVAEVEIEHFYDYTYNGVDIHDNASETVSAPMFSFSEGGNDTAYYSDENPAVISNYSHENYDGDADDGSFVSSSYESRRLSNFDQAELNARDRLGLGSSSDWQTQAGAVSLSGSEQGEWVSYLTESLMGVVFCEDKPREKASNNEIPKRSLSSAAAGDRHNILKSPSIDYFPANESFAITLTATGAPSQVGDFDDEDDDVSDTSGYLRGINRLSSCDKIELVEREEMPEEFCKSARRALRSKSPKTVDAGGEEGDGQCLEYLLAPLTMISRSGQGFRTSDKGSSVWDGEFRSIDTISSASLSSAPKHSFPAARLSRFDRHELSRRREARFSHLSRQPQTSKHSRPELRNGVCLIACN